MCCCLSWCCDKLDGVRLMTPFLAADATWLWIQGFRSFFGAIWEGGWWNAFVAMIIVTGCLPTFIMAVRARYFNEESRAKWFMIYAGKNFMLSAFSLMWAFVAFGWKWPAAGLVWLFTVPFCAMGAYISYTASGASLTMETFSKVRRLGGGGGRFGTDGMKGEAFQRSTTMPSTGTRLKTLDVASFGGGTLKTARDQTIYSSKSLITPVNGRRVLPLLETARYEVPTHRSSSKSSLAKRNKTLGGSASTLSQGYKKRSQSAHASTRGRREVEEGDGLHYLETPLHTTKSNHYMNTGNKLTFHEYDNDGFEQTDETGRGSVLRNGGKTRASSRSVERKPRLSTNEKLATFYANLPTNALSYPVHESATDLEAGMSAGNMSPKPHGARRGSEGSGSHQSRRSRRSRQSNGAPRSSGRKASRSQMAQGIEDTSV